MSILYFGFIIASFFNQLQGDVQNSAFNSELSGSLRFPAIVHTNWPFITSFYQDDPFPCWLQKSNNSITLSRSCRLSTPIEVKSLLNYVPLSYISSVPASPVFSNDSTFEISFQLNRVDQQLNRDDVSVSIHISLGSLFIYSYTLQNSTVTSDFRFLFAFPSSELKDTEVAANLWLNYHFSVDYSLGVIPNRNPLFEDAVLIKITNLSISFVQPAEKYPLHIRTRDEINLQNVDSFLESELSRDFVDEKCELLGFPHANILNRIEISSYPLQKDIRLPRVFCGAFTTEKQHSRNIKVSSAHCILLIFLCLCLSVEVTKGDMDFQMLFLSCV
jgi:hypothetical protein